jgi:protein-S-isoprenylcysteine O-methyltransferase Ste14
MSPAPENPLAQEKSTLKAGINARITQILIMFVLLWLELFLGSGHFNWKAGWVFMGISLLNLAVNAVFMFSRSPQTIAERGKPGEAKSWDKLIAGIWFLEQYLLLPLVAAFDVRFGWSAQYSNLWQGLGAVGYAAGLGLTSWAMISNAYFSTAARIQADRGQQVCRTGPYRYVRHPGYVGFFIQALCVPILLGSLWALLLAVPAVILMVLRTTLEDRMLQEELEGYKEYAQDVKYRLFPGVW